MAKTIADTLKLVATTEGFDAAGLTLNQVSDKLVEISKKIGDVQKVDVFSPLEESGKRVINELQGVVTVVDGLGNSFKLVTEQIGKTKERYRLVADSVVNSTGDMVKAEEDRKKKLEQAAKKLEADAKKEESQRRARYREIKRYVDQELKVERDRVKAIEDASKRAIKAGREEWQVRKLLAQQSNREAAIPMVSGLNQELGGFKSNFTNSGILAIDRANKSVLDILTKTGMGEARLREVFVATKTNNRTILATLSEDEQKLSIGLRRMAGAFETAANAGKRTQNIMIGMHGIIRLLQVQQMHGVISSLQNYFQQADEKALQLIGKIAEIQTISQDAKLSTDQWKDSLIQLSNAYGLDVMDVAKAGYEAVSNQIAQGAAITPFLAQSFEFARATSSTAAQSVDLLSAALNGYGLGLESVQKVSSILFKTIDVGRVTAAELANTLGNSTPIANALGISLEELGAGIATLTIQGIRPHTSLTLMNNIMLKLLKPTSDMKELLDEWGVASGQAAIEAFGFGGVLARLDKEFQSGGLGRIAELAGDMRAIRAEAGLLAGGSFDKFNENLNKMIHGQELYNEAVKITAESIATKLAKEQQKLNNLFIGEVGTRKNEIFLRTVEQIGGLDRAAAGLATGLVTVTDLLGQAAVAAYYLTVPFELLGLGMGRILPTILSSGIAYLTLARTFAPLAKNLLLTNVSMGDLMATGNSSLPVLARMAQGLGIVELNASRTALQFTKMAANVGNFAMVGIPLAIAAYSYFTAMVEEAERKRANAASDFLNRLSESSLETTKRIQFANQKVTEDTVSGFKENLKNLNLYYSVFQSRLNAFSKEALGVTSKFKTEDFENSLIGKTSIERLALLAQRFKEINTAVKDLSINNKWEEAQKSTEKLLDITKSYRQEQQKILDIVTKVTEKLKEQSEDKEFEYSIFNKSQRRQFRATAGRADEFKDQALGALGVGDLDTADKLIERAISIREKAQSISESIASSRGFGRPKGLEDYQELLRIRGEINKQIGDSAKKDNLTDMESVARSWDTNINKMIGNLEAVKTKMQELNSEAEKLKSAFEKAQSIQAEKQTNFRDSVKAYASEAADFMGREKQYSVQFHDEAPKEHIAIWHLRRKLAVEHEALAKDLLEGKPEAKLKERAEEVKKVIQDIGNAYSSLNEKTLKYNEMAVIAVTPPMEFQTGKGDRTKTFGTTFREIFESGRDITEKDKEYQKQITLTNDLKVAVETVGVELKKSAETLGTLLRENVPEALKAVNEALKNSNDGTKELINSTTKLMKELKESSGSTIPFLKDIEPKGGTIQGRANGGLLNAIGKYANGGYLNGPFGRDNMLIRAHGGEFMVNAESAANFRPQLAAINSFSNPTSYNTGGPITQVGDIHINANVTGDSTADVIEIGHKLNREMLRGTVRLGRRYS